MDKIRRSIFSDGIGDYCDIRCDFCAPMGICLMMDEEVIAHLTVARTVAEDKVVNLLRWYLL